MYRARCLQVLFKKKSNIKLVISIQQYIVFIYKIVQNKYPDIFNVCLQYVSFFK